MTLRLPGLDHRDPLAWSARHAAVWCARDATLVARSGQVGVLTRTTAAAAVDDYGVSDTCVHSECRWEKVDTNGDSVRDRFGLLLTTDLVKWPTFFDAVALSGMVQFIERGTVGTASAGLFYLGNDGVTGARLFIESTGTYYRFVSHNGTSSKTSTLAVAPTSGQEVRLRWHRAADGNVQLWQSINGGAESTGGASTGGLSLVAFGAAQYVRLNSVGTGNLGSVLALGWVVDSGLQTEATLKAALTT